MAKLKRGSRVKYAGLSDLLAGRLGTVMLKARSGWTHVKFDCGRKAILQEGELLQIDAPEDHPGWKAMLAALRTIRELATSPAPGARAETYRIAEEAIEAAVGKEDRDDDRKRA